MDVRLHVVVVGLAGDLFDHGAEQEVPVVAVLPATSRLELETTVAVQPHVVNERAEFQAVRPGLAAENVACNMLIGVAREHQGAPGLPEHGTLTRAQTAGGPRRSST